MSTPNDPLLNQQWHLTNAAASSGAVYDLNVAPAWSDYTGAGVVVAVYDDGVDHHHPDLTENYRHDLDVDLTAFDGDADAHDEFDAHGTAVAGLIAAADNGVGGVGVAPDAEIFGIRDSYSITPSAVNLSEVGVVHPIGLTASAQADVVNHSWGWTSPFFDILSDPEWAAYATAYESTVLDGRDGLGTVNVHAGGNERDVGIDLNLHGFDSSRYGIAVAALDEGGGVSWYSTPGAGLLVSAFGTDWAVTTTDVVGAGGYEPGDYTGFGGTSAAAPQVSGVVALMLEANPLLGYRDVMEILAYSARQTFGTVGEAGTGWQINGATNWNGGGLHASHDAGFGLVDAHAAVRLAETWHDQQTAYNEASAGGSFDGGALVDGGTWTDTVTVDASAGEIDLEHVEVTLALDHDWMGDLTVVLISPDGTESVLVNRPQVSDSDPFGMGDIGPLTFTATTTQHWGETAGGVWTLEIADAAGLGAGVLQGWSIDFYGSAASADDVYIYTDEFSAVAAADGARQSLSDASGDDILNVAAMTGDQFIDLAAESTSMLNGVALEIAAGTVIETVYAGDGDDTIRGNGADNQLHGGRGDDVLHGGTGADVLFGGAGADWFVFDTHCGPDTVADFGLAEGDVIDLSAFGLDYAGLAHAVVSTDAGTSIDLGGGDSVLLAGVSAFDLTNDHLFI